MHFRHPIFVISLLVAFSKFGAFSPSPAAKSDGNEIVEIPVESAPETPSLSEIVVEMPAPAHSPNQQMEKPLGYGIQHFQWAVRKIMGSARAAKSGQKPQSPGKPPVIGQEKSGGTASRPSSTIQKFQSAVKKVQMENKMSKITDGWKNEANRTRSLKQEYLRKIVKPDKYYRPEPFGGIITQADGGKWPSSSDPMVAALLEFSKRIMAAEFPDELEKLERELRLPAGGCKIAFLSGSEADDELFHNAFLFEQGCMHTRETAKMEEKRGDGWVEKGVRGKRKDEKVGGRNKEEEEKLKEGGKKNEPGKMEDGKKEAEDASRHEIRIDIDRLVRAKEQEKLLKTAAADPAMEHLEKDFYNEEYKVKLSTMVLLGAIQEGPAAFGENAELDWTKLPKFVGSFKGKKEEEEREERREGMMLMAKRVVNLLRGKAVYKVKDAEEEKKVEGANVDRMDTGGGGGESADPVPEVRINIMEEEEGGEGGAEEIVELREWTEKQKEELATNLVKTIEGMEKKKMEEGGGGGGISRSENINNNGQTAREKIVEKKMHPWKFLQRMRYEIRVKPADERLQENGKAKGECERVQKEMIEKALYHSDHQVAQHLRGRLGAQILFSVINIKKFTRDLFIAMLASLAFSGTLSTLLNIVAWKSLVGHVAFWEAKKYLGKKEPFTPILKVVLNSITTFFTQFGDSFLVARWLVKMRGGNIFPNKGQVWEDFKDSLKSSPADLQEKNPILDRLF